MLYITRVLHDSLSGRFIHVLYLLPVCACAAVWEAPKLWSWNPFDAGDDKPELPRHLMLERLAMRVHCNVLDVFYEAVVQLLAAERHATLMVLTGRGEY
jgi:hypothetical protein